MMWLIVATWYWHSHLLDWTTSDPCDVSKERQSPLTPTLPPPHPTPTSPKPQISVILTLQFYSNQVAFVSIQFSSSPSVFSHCFVYLLM
ncbi:unnamed protein product [Lactuca virosa]|uniref:Secreted protein n=1 Tax=Lactuca virosa TaxID=75947 RepID=A0AAU9PWU0_9ASTR|nr:unnamed protein product [Lactuca virosa]